jgi:hypothetical protein
MKTTHIARNEWPSFFDGFSRQHEGWLVTLEIFQPDIGAQVEERDLVLEGVTAELGNGDKDKIEIMIGGKPNQHVTHTVLNRLKSVSSIRKTARTMRWQSRALTTP